MDWNTLDEATIKEREREYGGKYRKLYEVVDRLEKDPNLSTKQIMALPDLQFALNFFDMPGIMADYLPTGEIYKINTSERQKDGYGWLDMDWVWNKVVEFEEDYLAKRTSTQQAQSMPMNSVELQTLVDRILKYVQNKENTGISFFESCKVDGLVHDTNQAAIQGLSDRVDKLLAIENDAIDAGYCISDLSSFISFYLLPLAKGKLKKDAKLIKTTNEYAGFVGYFNNDGELSYPIFPHKDNPNLNLAWHKQEHRFVDIKTLKPAEDGRIEKIEWYEYEKFEKLLSEAFYFFKRLSVKPSFGAFIKKHVIKIILLALAGVSLLINGILNAAGTDIWTALKTVFGGTTSVEKSESSDKASVISPADELLEAGEVK